MTVTGIPPTETVFPTTTVLDPMATDCSGVSNGVGMPVGEGAMALTGTVVEPMTTRGGTTALVGLAGVEVLNGSCKAKGVVSAGAEFGSDVGDGVGGELPDTVDIEVVVNKRAPLTAEAGAIEYTPQSEGRVSFNRDCSHPFGHAPAVSVSVYRVPN